MAFMNQEKKKVIANALKAVVPKTWKYSLKVEKYSKIVMTIRKTDDDTILSLLEGGDYKSLNPYYVGEKSETLQSIINALNTNNFDNSDSQSDYFSVGHYVDIQIGEWNKPYTHLN